MLIAIFIRLLTLVAAATGVVADPRDVDVVEASPRVAQVRLAEALGTADAIHSVSAKHGTVTFAIARGDRSLRVIAQTRSKTHEVMTLTITQVTEDAQLSGGLSWLADELESVAAVTRLVPDADGAVTVHTDDGRRYMLIPGRGSGGPGNDAVEARWAAQWDRR